MGQLSSSNAHPPNKRRRLRRTFQAGLGISLSRSAVDKSSETRRSAANTTHPSPDTIASLSPVTITNGHPDDQSLTSAYASYSNFLERYPCYRLTSNLDELQKKEFKRLNRASEKTVYVDYMGGGLYPESLVLKHLHFLQEHVLGNTHSLSPSSCLSARAADDARRAVLDFFKAPPGYTVIFTSNASAALKLVAESYPFEPGGTFLLPEDAHNSVHGIRQFANRSGASSCYIPSTPVGGIDETALNRILEDNASRTSKYACLLAITGQSNMTNCKYSPELVSWASSLGYHVILDAAALAPTSPISLVDTPVDAMAISFYKMFGYPTGVGALVAKDTFLGQLRRPWFAGGTVSVVQTPGQAYSPALAIHEQFEDGSINYLSLPAIIDGLHLLSTYLPILPLRLSALLDYLASELLFLRHASTGTAVVRVLSRLPSKVSCGPGEQSDTGFLLSLLFLTPDGTLVPLSLVERAAAARRISLRTGCMCNPGGAAALLRLQDMMAGPAGEPGITRAELESWMGMELGVVRISLGLGSNFDDVHEVIEFGRKFLDMEWLEGMRCSN